MDQAGAPIPASALDTLTLSIVDPLTGETINNASQVDILNTGRGSVSSSGRLTVQLEVGDTALAYTSGQEPVQRSLVLDWTYGSSPLTGRHQVNFTVLALAGP